ncbi:hypothetical protein CRM22_007036 [Opisthorchis felineus]|uniref:Glycosyltransferase-like protein LARGE2 n=1 Tax=Opisthorchis felineus TaxID=147828 RepID=A0A4V3SE49_OPIFE|nr:hypothetical protein CRM22_007036 [Opisthorchis felineus]
MRRLYRFILCLFALVGILHLFRALNRFRVLRLDPIPFAPQYDAIYLAGRRTNDLEPIELFTVINGACAANRAVVSLKSMLYFQGRYKTASKFCPSVSNRPPGIVCQNQSLEPYRPVRLHWVADVAAKDRLIYIFEEWHPSDVHIYLYNYEQFVSYVGAIPINHYAGTPAMYKILAPYILPEEVTKVIVLDSDVIFNYNVLELWKEFERFKPQQVFGAACEQITYCPYSCSSDDTHLPLFGINSGVVLMNLTELRRTNWWYQWQQEVLKEVTDLGYLPVAEQKVINEIMGRNITLYYRLGCEWNVQVFKADGIQCCPVQWIDRLPHETYCKNNLDDANPREPARLVHYNIKRKPEGCGQYAPSSMDFQAGLAEMSRFPVLFGELESSQRLRASGCFTLFWAD